jgi:hypothetical protein
MRVRVANERSAFESQLDSRTVSKHSRATRRGVAILLETICGLGPQIKPLIGSAEWTISRVAESAERESAFQFFCLLSITALSSDRSLPAAISNIRMNTPRGLMPELVQNRFPPGVDATTLGRIHFFLCIGYFRFHDTSDRFDTKRARNARPMCRPDVGWDETERDRRGTRGIRVSFIRRFEQPLRTRFLGNNFDCTLVLPRIPREFCECNSRHAFLLLNWITMTWTRPARFPIIDTRFQDHQIFNFI